MTLTIINRSRGCTGLPRTTWLRTTGEDLQSQNFGVHAHGMEEGKGERYLAPGRQYGNALLGVRYQEEEVVVVTVCLIIILAAGVTAIIISFITPPPT